MQANIGPSSGTAFRSLWVAASVAALIAAGLAFSTKQHHPQVGVGATATQANVIASVPAAEHVSVKRDLKAAEAARERSRAPASVKPAPVAQKNEQLSANDAINQMGWNSLQQQLAQEYALAQQAKANDQNKSNSAGCDPGNICPICGSCFCVAETDRRAHGIFLQPGQSMEYYQQQIQAAMSINIQQVTQTN